MRHFGTWGGSRLFDENGGGDQGGGGGGQTQTETPEQKITRLERENGELKTGKDAAEAKAKEHEDSAKFWHEKAKGGASHRDGQPRPEPEPEDDTDLLELAGKGPKAMKDWLKKQGFVSRDEAEQLTNSKAQAMVRQAEVMRKYPDLSDQSSEFFKSVTAEYGRLKQQGVPDLVAMETAADLVGARTSRRTTTDDDEKGGERGGDKGGERGGDRHKETEDERRRRANAQNGGGRGRTSKQEESDDLDETQKAIADAMGISHDAYKKRAKEGVQFARNS